ncbi:MULTISPECIES: SDR family oxidoreductase [unclassified Paraburkholderia]|uniref:SDR family oxidoreductase n=1 Tax=unclassified Paraburkholderia TaxID=2615204 RepID=UPI001623016B|nr:MULTISPECIES: SDR family oxidoreductase [unclassified Paraburkholderia]
MPGRAACQLVSGPRPSTVRRQLRDSASPYPTACCPLIKGVCANGIAPGTFKTEMARSQWEDPAMVAWYEQLNPSKPFGDVDEIAAAAVMLASSAGAKLNAKGVTPHGDRNIQRSLARAT